MHTEFLKAVWIKNSGNLQKMKHLRIFAQMLFVQFCRSAHFLHIAAIFPRTLARFHAGRQLRVVKFL